jgi:CPA1 family monovalent cation:H+ antiporter
MPGGHVADLVAVAYIVTVGTLLLQGLTLPLLIRGLKVSSRSDIAADNREIARMRTAAGEAGIEYLREQQQAWVEKYGVESVDAFNRFSRGLLRIEKGSDQGERDLDSVTQKIAVGGIGHLTYDDLHELSRGWLAVRRRVAFEQCRAGNLSEEVMREVFAAIDAEELVLDTKGSLRKE